MQEKLVSFYNSTLEKWNGLEKNQKIRLVLTVFIVLGVLIATIYITTRPKMILLKSDLDYKVAGQIKTALDEEKILNKYANNGTAIMVEEKDVDRAQVALSVKNIPNDNSFTYADAMKNSGMGATETIKRENLRRLRQSDLERQVMTVEGIDNAFITLDIPDTTNFLQSQTQQPSASAVLTINRPFDRAQALAVARIISRGVVGLEMQNIDIVDQYANSLYSGSEQNVAGGVASNFDTESQRKRELEAKMKSIISPLYNDVKVLTNLVFNWDEAQQVSKSYSSALGPDSPSGLIAEEVVSSTSVVNGEAGAEPGTAANDATAPNYAAGNNQQSTADTSDKSTKYIYDETEQMTKTGVGNVVLNRSSASIIAYKYRTYDEANMTKNNLLNGQTWEEFKNSVTDTPIPVDPGILNNLQTGTGIQDLTINAYEVPLFVDAVVQPVNIPQIVMFVILAILLIMLAYALIRKTEPEEIADVEPELAVDGLLVSPKIEEEKEKEIESTMSDEKLKEIAYGPDSEVMRQIEKFIDEKPEAAAALLRNWLNEEWDE